MSHYTKEKNLIIIDLDKASGNYKLDMNTGLFYGLKGTPIKTIPSCSIYHLFPYDLDKQATNLTRVLRRAFSEVGSKALLLARYTKAIQSADKLDAIGLPVQDYYQRDHWEFLGDHIKELVAYLKTVNNFQFVEFENWLALEEAKKKYGTSVVDQLTPRMWKTLMNTRINLTTEEIGVCAYYLGRGKMWDYTGGNICRLIEYIDFCRLMEKTPLKVNNFMREYCETRHTYELRKIEFDNKQIADNYAKHKKAWEFEYGNHTIVLPTCGQDIVTEGNLMHHCVGSYVDRVIQNDTYIVFVRHKDNPNVPYITCQVHTNGCIGQYFLSHDRYISSEEDRAFYNAFAEHLAKVW